MKNNNSTFCTISTADHLYKTYALAESLLPYNCKLSVLLLDKEIPNDFKLSNLSFFKLDYINDSHLLKIRKKYKGDKLRWSLKSIFLRHLLLLFEKSIYVDNDIFFFSDPTFLFNLLNENDILLTPHRYPINPENNQNWLEANFRVGLYNAGFIAANRNGIKALEWWTKACVYRCEKNYFRGLFDDQKYLDLIPIIHQNTLILKHLGCNVAYWNIDCCPVTYDNNQFIVTNKFPLVFYHFNHFSLINLRDNDLYFQDYLSTLKKYNTSFSVKNNSNLYRCINNLKILIWKILNKFNH